MSKISIDFKTGKLKTKLETIVGIDLGTTNSLIAYIVNGVPAILPIGKNSSGIFPSIVHFGEHNINLFGEEAKAEMIRHSNNTIFSFKRLMGKTYSEIEDIKGLYVYNLAKGEPDELVKFEIAKTKYSPLNLSALLLEHIKQLGEAFLQTNISKAVITVPAYFTDSQRQATREAGIQAGFNVLRIINEPTAASMAYGIGLKRDQIKQVMVYDFGGGTFDVSLLRIENGIFEVLATQGDNFLGGDDIDNEIVAYWSNKYELIQSTESLKELRLLAEDCKKELIKNENTHIEFHGVSLSLSLVKLNLLSEEIVNKTIRCCKQALIDSKLEQKAIDEIILVGGSSRLSLVKQKLISAFQKPINDFLNPDEVVALGAAIQADILAGNRTDLLLLDITALSLGIETLGGLMDVIISRNSKIPLQLAHNYTTSKDGQKNLKISVYQGEREMVENNIKLAEFILSDLPPMAAGLPKIEVKFSMDADGILSVKAKELRSGVEQSIEVRSAHSIDEEAFGKHLKDSITFAEKDLEKKSIIAAVNEANYILENSLKFINQNTEHLSKDEIVKLQKEITKLRLSLNSNNESAIKKAMINYNLATSALAHRIMDIQLKKSLGGSSIENI